MYDDENAPAAREVDRRVDLMRQFVDLEKAEMETRARASKLDAKSRDIRSSLDECREELVHALTADQPKKAERGTY